MSETTTAPLSWHNEKRRVLDLVPYGYNPRKITEERLERLKKSLSKYNLAEVPAINTDNTIVAGHQRVKVLVALGRGEEEIDVRVPNRKLTEQEFKEYNVISNVPVGYWDVDVLEEVFDDIDLSALGLDIDDIELPKDIVPDDFKVDEEGDVDPEPPSVPITKEGDVYEFHSLEKGLVHRVVCGSSTVEKSFEEVLMGQEVDLIVTDPPYNVDYVGKGQKNANKIQNDNLANDDFYNFLLDFYSLAYKNLKSGGPVYVFHADTEGVNFRKAFVDAGLKLSQCLIWLKNSIVMGRQDYHWKHEPCLYGWKEGAAHKWYSDRKQSTILEFNRPTKSEDHPTMKPVDLLQYLIENSSERNDVVFDGFLGSGATLMACELSYRNCRGIELMTGYVDVELKRWVNYMNENKRDFKIVKNGFTLNPDEVEIYFND